MTRHKLLVNRRELFGLFGSGLLVIGGLRPQQEPDFLGLDHFEFYVSDVEKSRDFFVRIFGKTLLNRGAKRYLKLGATYMAFEPPRGGGAAGRVDHVSVAIKQLNMARLHQVLEQRGIAFQDYPSGRDTAVLDPDGTRLQLSPEDGWSILNPPNFMPEVVIVADEPLFQPTGLDHVLFNVTDTEKSTAFYQKFLGPPAQRDSSGIWFQTGTSRVGIVQTAPGQRVGVHHICVSVATFNYENIVRRLEQIGARIEAPDVPGVATFRDLDGLLIQARGSRA